MSTQTEPARDGVEPAAPRALVPPSLRPGPWLALPMVIAAVVVLGALTTGSFLTSGNLTALLVSMSVTGIVAVAMTPMTLSGNFVSLAAQQSTMLAMVVFIAALAHGWNPVLAVLVTVALLIVVGAVQGVVIALGLNPIITTLAAGAIIYGGVSSATNSNNVAYNGHEFSWIGNNALGVPVLVWIFVAVTIATSLLIERGGIGRRVRLVGSNRETARITGISWSRTTISAFAIFSVGVAIAGISEGSVLGEANVLSVPTLTIDSIAALLVGGTAIQGGLGSPLRSAAGAVLIGLITNIMVLHNASAGFSELVEGVLVVVIVIVLHYARRAQGAASR